MNLEGASQPGVGAAHRLSFDVERATGEPIEAVALVSPVPFSARYDLDRVTGVFSRDDHPLKGMPVCDQILIAPGVQGGVAAGWAFLAMKGRGVGFAGLVFGDINPVMVQGAVTPAVPIAAGVDEEIFDVVKSGDWVRIDPAAKTVVILGARAFPG